MKLHNKVLIITAAAFAALVLLVLTGEFFARRAKREASRTISLILSHDMAESAGQASLNEVLKTFSSLYPRILVTTRYVPPEEREGWPGADLIIGTGLGVVSQSSFLSPPIPWSGELWVLAARRDFLASASSRLAEAVKALREGTASPKQFESLLSDAARQGLIPFTFGNSHKWPFLLLLQHWTAATKGPRAAENLPPLPESGEAKPYAEYREPFADLMRWKTEGWFPKNLWGEGWAMGLGPLDRGMAAFALVSSSYLSAITARSRAVLEYLPFPRREKDGPWSVGKASFLGVARGTKEKESAKLLEKFLSSPGITSRLAEMTGKPFFAWDPKTGFSPTVLQNWTSASMSPEYDAFSRAFDPGH